jgi:hypothetical protein
LGAHEHPSQRSELSGQRTTILEPGEMQFRIALGSRVLEAFRPRKDRFVNRALLALAGIATLLATAGQARADRRIFAYTYPYMTLPKDSLELEHYLDLGLNNWDNPATPALERDWTKPSWRHMVEFEYGITDRLDFGFYNVFKQDPFGTFKFDGVKARSRYRISDPAVHAIDTALYGELSYFGDKVEVEQKLILSKILGQVEVVFNGTAKEVYAMNAKQWEYMLTPAMAIGYHLSNSLALGAEYTGRAKFKSGEMDYFASYLGPAISFARGAFYWTLGAQWQLGKRADMPSIQVRSLLGIVL